MNVRTGLLIALIAAAATAGFAQDTARKNYAMRDSATHDQLSQKLRMAQQKDPLRDLGPAIGDVEKDPSKLQGERDLIKESTILCYKGFLTLVPQKAVLHLPEHLKDRFEAKPGIKVVTWKDFYQGNRGWIRTLEVSREQAMGQQPLPEEITKSFEGSNSVVVAVFKGGPISVLPYKEPEATDPAATPDNAAQASTSAALSANETKPAQQP